MFDRDKHVDTVEEYLRAYGSRLLYLTFTGSKLHGTETPDSDVDVTGIFLPSRESCLLGEQEDLLKLDTSSDKVKNTSEDVDTVLWSVQYWLKKVGQGELNAVDLVYSFASNHNELYRGDDELNSLWMHPNSLFNFESYCKKVFGMANSVLAMLPRYKADGVEPRWKNLSHALRHIRQMAEIFKSGYIRYPLVDSDYLRGVKLGEYLLEEVEFEIRCGLARLKRLEKNPVYGYKHDLDFTSRFIVSLY